MKKPSALLILVLLPALLIGRYEPAYAADKDVEKLRKDVKAMLDGLHAKAEFPGATVGFVLPDGRSASVSTGLADVENNIALKPDDRMLAGSIGKTYVAAVTLQLAQEGKLNLDEKIERWFGREPWFDRLANAKEITVRMLMNHTSGLVEYYLLKDCMKTLKEKPDKVWRSIASLYFPQDRGGLTQTRTSFSSE
jgi:D-alanyl-D-alanine carboxypeptidase